MIGLTLNRLNRARKEKWNVNPVIAIDLARTGRLTDPQLLTLGYKAKDENAWLVIRDLIDFSAFSLEFLMDVGVKAKSCVMWTTIIATSKLGEEQLISVCSEYTMPEIFSAVIKTGKLNAEQMLEEIIPRASATMTVMEVIRTGKLTIQQMLDLGYSREKNDDIWAAIIRQIGGEKT